MNDFKFRTLSIYVLAPVHNRCRSPPLEDILWVRLHFVMEDFFDKFDSKCLENANYVALFLNLEVTTFELQTQIVNLTKYIMQRPWGWNDQELIRLMVLRNCLHGASIEYIQHVSNLVYLDTLRFPWSECATILHGKRCQSSMAYILRTCKNADDLTSSIRFNKSVIFTHVDHLTSSIGTNQCYEEDVFCANAKLLVWYGANVLNPEGGQTLLQYVYAQKLPNSVKIPVIRNLMEYGIDLSHKDESGNTIYDDAINNKDWIFLKFMVTRNFPYDVEALKKLRNLPCGPLFTYLEGCADELLVVRRQHDARQLLVDFSRGCVQLNLQDGIRILTTKFVESTFRLAEIVMERWSVDDAAGNSVCNPALVQCNVFNIVTCRTFDLAIRWITTDSERRLCLLRNETSEVCGSLYTFFDMNMLPDTSDFINYIRRQAMTMNFVRTTLQSPDDCHEAVKNVLVATIIEMWPDVVRQEWVYNLPVHLLHNIQCAVASKSKR